MIAQHLSDPQQYRQESAGSSRLWNLWLPVLVFIAIPFLAWKTPDFFANWFAREDTGILEFLHFFLPLLTALIGLRLCFSPLIRQDKFLLLWCAAMFVGGIFLSGEEASWGQHYLGWATPEGWSELNDQQETNLHNVSHLLDQLPRGVLVAGIMITGLIYPWILLNRPGLLPKRFNFTYPPLALVPLALVTAACWGYRGLKKTDMFDAYLIYRPGEFQELFIVWYLFYYALFLLWRERHERQMNASTG